MSAIVNIEKCTGCEACVSSCPVEAISMVAVDDKAKVSNECIDCGACVDECSADAITMD